MAKKKNSLLALPDQAGRDVKALSSIVDRWAEDAESIGKDAFAWVRKHKFLVAIALGLVLFKRYWLDEGEDRSDEDY